MKLYYLPAACPLSPHIVLNELGIDAELIAVDNKKHTFGAGEDFEAVNPLGYVPALELEDGVILTEGPAIIQYLADLKPELGLAPANGTMERYRLQQCLNFLFSEIHKGFIPLLYARLAGPYVETAKPKLEKRYAHIDAELATRPYIAGGTFTVADAYLFALTGWGQAPWLASYYRADIHFDGLLNLQAWYERVQSRPSIQKALRAEGLMKA
ncbi:glutathione binding-like protein [Rhizobium sp. CF142]|uniref:glutathione binding-like protein n=1 Tax=Rhizobium sp. CF142 TaxID=1144314 RepID=UPI00026EED5E|nr:glutathione binding-like protein [Rhizobium sp. CF142]EJJ29076.1 glutathione S-transferase [Rhizobium sp. CF142]